MGWEEILDAEGADMADAYNDSLPEETQKEHTFWTDGYFACSVGNVSEEVLKRYIGNQG